MLSPSQRPDHRRNTQEEDGDGGGRPGERLLVETPYSSIALALFLMVFGIACFVVAWLHATQQFLGKAQAVSTQHWAP